MEILLLPEIFSKILKKLPLKELILLRGVCHQWKDWIDEYLRNQTVLLIDDLSHEITDRRLEVISDPSDLSMVTQTLDINLNLILSNRLVISTENIQKKDFASSVTRTFPNIEILCVYSEADLWDEYNVFDKTPEDLDYITMLNAWQGSLRKLIVAHLSDVTNLVAEPFFEALDRCEKLEAFAMLDDIDNEDFCMTGSEKFLVRLTALYVPTFVWIENLEHAPYLVGLAVHTRHNDYHFKDQLKRERFPVLKRLYIGLDSHQEGRKWDALAEIADFRFENLESLEFNHVHNEYFEEEDVSKYPKFFDQLTNFPGIKTLKFQIDHPLFLEHLFKASENFLETEKLVIYYKAADNEGELPESFQEILPKRMARIQTLEFHVFQMEPFEALKKVAFWKLFYKVKIFHDL